MSRAQPKACPWECHSYGHPIGNVPWDGTGINCYGMGMRQINMSHGQLRQLLTSYTGTTQRSIELLLRA